MKALVLAGGFPQIALINELKSRGVFVILADYTEHPVAMECSDKFLRISTLDIEAIRNAAISEKVDFLITACTDQALHTVAKVSEELGLPCYIDSKTALNVTNKQYMKQVFLKNGIPSPRHVIMGELDLDRIATLRYPLIVKPVDCNSSKGVRKCTNLCELMEFFANAVEFSRTNTAIVEEFVEGLEISVDVYIENGKAKVLCISNSDKIADKDKFIIFRALWPSPVSAAAAEKIAIVAQQIADAFNIKNSPMLIQFLVDDNDVHVIEFSARTGGGVKYLLIKRTSGFDVIKAVVDLTLGQLPRVGEIVPEQKYLVNDFIYCKPGVFDSLSGFDELMNEGILKDRYLFKSKGSELTSISASGDRVAGYTVTANSTEELIEKHRTVRSRIRVLSESGEDIIRHDLLTGLIEKDGFVVSE